MVVEYNDEYCKIILRKDINTEPYEVIDIVDLLEVWEKHKADTPQTDIHGITDCDFCKHGSEEWDSEACDGCCNANNHFEPKEQTERSSE